MIRCNVFWDMHHHIMAQFSFSILLLVQRATGVCLIWNHTINLPDLWNHTFNLSDHWNHTINLPDLSLSFLRSSTFLANGNISCRADDWRSFPHKIVFLYLSEICNLFSVSQKKIICCSCCWCCWYCLNLTWV